MKWRRNSVRPAIVALKMSFTLPKQGGINNVRFQPYRIFNSKCYSDDRRISCISCHNPHEPLKQDAAFYDAKCLACHQSKQKTATSSPADGNPLRQPARLKSETVLNATCRRPSCLPPISCSLIIAFALSDRASNIQINDQTCKAKGIHYREITSSSSSPLP